MKLGTDSYYLCVSGNADSEGNDAGEWRIIVEKRRSFWERLTGKGKINSGDPLLKIVVAILSEQSNIEQVHLEVSALDW